MKIEETPPETIGRLTVDDLEGYNEGDGNRYELIEGVLYVTTQPSLEHQLVSDAVCGLLRQWNRQSGGGGIAVSAPGIILAPDEAFAPDVVWYSQERLAEYRQPNGKFSGPPDLAVEVLSPGSSNARRDRKIKPARYAFWGVREYWLVDREARRVELFRPQGDSYGKPTILSEDETLNSPLLPGFACAVSELFIDLPS